MIAITNLSSKQLRRIASLKGKVESIQQKLSRILGTPPQIGDGATPRKRRRMSARARAKIGAAVKARWAKLRGRKSATKPVKKVKRIMSTSARKKISLAAKARWKRAKAAGKNTL